MPDTDSSGNSIVSIAKCGSYADNIIEPALEKALGPLGGMARFVKKGNRVLLKVNLLIGKPPEDAVTTHPALVRAVINQVKKAGGKPEVGDSPSASMLQPFEHAAAVSGFKEVCDELDVPLVELTHPEEVACPNGAVSKTFLLSHKLKGYDVIINMPKLKTHSLTIFTGSVKNLYGCIPGAHKAAGHVTFQDSHRFSEMLLDLYTVARPDLNIMDGIIGMEGNGPSGGDPVKIGVIIAGDNAIAVDAVATTVAGIYDYVPLFRLAKKKKLPGASLSSIHLVGEKIEDVLIPPLKMPEHFSYAMAPGFLKGFIRNQLLDRPMLDEPLCIGCESCANICPKKAITMINKRPQFDYRKCIRCYCCQEVCPQKAIVLKGSIFSIFRKKKKQEKK